MFSEQLDLSILIYIAAITQAFAFLSSRALTLRIASFTAAVFYFLYYWLFPVTPLLDAMLISGIIGSTNLVILFILLYKRMIINSNKNTKELYEDFSTFGEDEFYELMKLGVIKDSPANQEIKLITGGTRPDSLYYVMNDSAIIRNEDGLIIRVTKTFIGELAYLLGVKTTTDVFLASDTKYIEWRYDSLDTLSFEQKLKLKSLIINKIARKNRDFKDEK